MFDNSTQQFCSHSKRRIDKECKNNQILDKGLEGDKSNETKQLHNKTMILLLLLLGTLTVLCAWPIVACEC